MSGWTQPLCDDCWDSEHPDRPATRVGGGEPERCCMCGKVTVSGIYVRKDPASVPYPGGELVSAGRAEALAALMAHVTPMPVDERRALVDALGQLVGVMVAEAIADHEIRMGHLSVRDAAAAAATAIEWHCADDRWHVDPDGSAL